MRSGRAKYLEGIALALFLGLPQFQPPIRAKNKREFPEQRTVSPSPLTLVIRADAMRYKDYPDASGFAILAAFIALTPPGSRTSSPLHCHLIPLVEPDALPTELYPH
jgi:hypothetical protein